MDQRHGFQSSSHATAPCICIIAPRNFAIRHEGVSRHERVRNSFIARVRSRVRGGFIAALHQRIVSTTKSHERETAVSGAISRANGEISSSFVYPDIYNATFPISREFRGYNTTGEEQPLRVSLSNGAAPAIRYEYLYRRTVPVGDGRGWYARCDVAFPLAFTSAV